MNKFLFKKKSISIISPIMDEGEKYRVSIENSSDNLRLDAKMCGGMQ